MSMTRHFPRSSLCVFILLFAFTPSSARNRLTPHRVELENGKKFTLKLPAAFEIIPAAQGLKRVRFFAAAPDGRIFVTDMYDLTDNKKGKVYILDGWDKAKGKFLKIRTYLSGLRNPNSAAFYTDERGQIWFYLAETDKLTRRKFRRGEIAPTDDDPEVIARFPDYGLSYKYGGWHLTRTIVFGGNGKLYVSVGSSCNLCYEKERVRASVLEMDPDGSNSRVFARGLRNAVGMMWLGRFLFATNQGADHLGRNRPDETFYAVREGRNYGWPSCYQSRGRIFRDRAIRGRGCRGVPRAYALFPAHSSALGFEYFDSSTKDPTLKNAFLVALHGSTNKALKKGYKLVIVRKGKRLQDFLTGFLKGRTIYGRPCDVFKLTPDSFLVSDDHGGVVYLIRKKSV